MPRVLSLRPIVVVLGESHRPRLYQKIGIDAQGNQIAITAETPQLILIIGGTGAGKTHLMRVSAEAAQICLPGLNTLSSPQRTIQMETDCNQGSTRRQMLEGFSPNGFAPQLEYLFQHYAYRARGNEAYTRGTLLVLPDSVKPLQKELAHLCERGLKILPAICGPQDLGMVGFRALIDNARGLSGSNKPRYMTTIETLLSEMGDNMLPTRLMEKIEQSGIRDDIKQGVLAQLRGMVDLVHEDARINDCLIEPAPVFVLLESNKLSPDFILPFQAILIHGLTRPLRDGSDPHRWIYVDEFNKSAENQVIVQSFRQTGQERRHHPYTVMVNGQRGTGMDDALFSLGTIYAVFRLTSKKEIRVLKERFTVFASVPDEEFMTLRTGECLIAATQTTGKAAIYRIFVRPTVTNAGGQTLRASEG